MRGTPLNLRRAPDGNVASDKSETSSSTAPQNHFEERGECRMIPVYQSLTRQPPGHVRSSMRHCTVLVCTLVLSAAAAPPAVAQVSSALPPQTIGRLPSDSEIPTELQQIQQLLAAGRRQDALARADAVLAKNPRDAQ